MRRWLVLRQPVRETLQVVVTIRGRLELAIAEHSIQVVNVFLTLLLQHRRP
jgi:hypothetical protein